MADKKQKTTEMQKKDDRSDGGEARRRVPTKKKLKASKIQEKIRQGDAECDAELAKIGLEGVPRADVIGALIRNPKFCAKFPDGPPKVRRNLCIQNELKRA